MLSAKIISSAKNHAVLWVCFLSLVWFSSASSANLIPQKEEVKVSSLIVSVQGDPLVIASATAPAISCTRESNSGSGNLFSNKSFAQAGFNNLFSLAAYFVYGKQLPLNYHFSLRLHLACRVLLI